VGWLIRANQSPIQLHNVIVATECHVDASITHSPRKPKTRLAYKVVSDREESDDETDAQHPCGSLQSLNPVSILKRVGLKKVASRVFDYQQHTQRRESNRGKNKILAIRKNHLSLVDLSTAM